MENPSRPRPLRLVEVLLGISMVGLALQQTHDAFHPVPGHIDGRGLFAVVIVPPIAAVGGLLVVHGARQWVQEQTRSAASLLAYPVGALLALAPSICYILWFSGADVSNRLSSYTEWFVLALLIGTLPVGYAALRHLLAGNIRDSNRD
jgi:hypothetical protein